MYFGAFMTNKLVSFDHLIQLSFTVIRRSEKPEDLQIDSHVAVKSSLEYFHNNLAVNEERAHS